MSDLITAIGLLFFIEGLLLAMFPSRIKNMLKYLTDGSIVNISDFYTQSHSFYSRNYYKFKNHNILIPIGHHYSFSQKIFARISRIVENCNINDIYDIYNGRVLNNLNYIERNGLYVDTNLIGLDNKKHIVADLSYKQINDIYLSIKTYAFA